MTSGSRDLFKLCEITDTMYETVKIRDIVQFQWTTNKKSYVASRTAAIPNYQ